MNSDKNGLSSVSDILVTDKYKVSQNVLKVKK